MMNQYSEVPTWFDASRYEAPQAHASPTPNWTSYSSPSASPISSDGYSMSSSPTPSHHNCGNPSVSVTSHAVLGGEGYEVQSTGMNLPMTSEDFREEKIRAHKEQNHRKKAQVKSNELLNSLVNMQYSEEGFEVQPAMQPSGRKMSAREIREAKIRAYKQNKAKNKALLLFDSHKY
jgi:hypothetical protein